jgi:hypothetical protein
MMSILALGGLTVIGLAILMAGQCPAEDQGKRPDDAESKKAAKMVEALANGNKPPKIVERREGWPRRLPLFPNDYDWKENERVADAVRDLRQNTTTELWEQVVQKANDSRFCITAWVNEEAVIFSLGDICRSLAYSRLTDGFRKHLPSLPPHGCPIQFEKFKRDLPAWRKERKDKSLYQLQIEMCELAIRALPDVDSKTLSNKEKANARKKIEAEIENLRKTKEPILEDYSGYLPHYGPALAKRIRKVIETGSSEDITIEK